MRIKKTIFIISVLLIMVSCKSNKIDNIIKSDDCMKLIIPENINNVLPIDSIFSNIRIVPLETNDNCLIGQIAKVEFYDDKIFLLDSFRKLLVFDINGKFLFNVGKVGRGPGEYPEIRDFDLDENGNIYVLTYQKILQFSKNGKYLKKIPLNFLA